MLFTRGGMSGAAARTGKLEGKRGKKHIKNIGDRGRYQLST